MSEETTIYDKNNIKITNLRAVFGGKTYSVSNITSVESKRIEPSGCLPIGLSISGSLFILVGVYNIKYEPGILMLGVLAFVLLFFSNRASKPTWSVTLTTAAGEVKACTSPDQQTIKQIVEAINNAIVQKG